MISGNLFERIRQLARDGFGYEDIAFRLNLPWREVRPFIIRGQHVSLSSLRLKAAGDNGEAEKLRTAQAVLCDGATSLPALARDP